jgi:hypothetical protein
MSEDINVNTDTAENQQKAKLVPIQFLFESYKPNFWYFEIIETFRRLLFTGFLALIYPGSTKQLVVGYFLSIGSIVLYAWLSPYVDKDVQFSSLLCQGQLSLLFFITILVKEKVAISGVFINILLVISIFFVLFYEAFGTWIMPYLTENSNNNNGNFASKVDPDVKDVELSEDVTIKQIELSAM